MLAINIIFVHSGRSQQSSFGQRQKDKPDHVWFKHILYISVSIV